MSAELVPLTRPDPAALAALTRSLLAFRQKRYPQTFTVRMLNVSQTVTTTVTAIEIKRGQS